MKKEATIIAVVNQKGGTAKITKVENLGIGLSNQGKKVFLIDADTQASLTISMKANETESIFKKDIDDIKAHQDELWQVMKSILQRLSTI